MLNERSKIKGKKTLLYFYKILESAYCSDRKQINSFLGMVAGASYDGREEGITKGHKETLGVMDMVIVLIVVIVPWVYTFVKIYQIVHFKLCADYCMSITPQ